MVDGAGVIGVVVVWLVLGIGAALHGAWWPLYAPPLIVGAVFVFVRGAWILSLAWRPIAAATLRSLAVRVEARKQLPPSRMRELPPPWIDPETGEVHRR